MTGIVWLILTICVAFIFVTIMAYRVISFAHRPVHLRWELAPVPRDKGKTGYGGSYLEDFEWWQKPRKITRIAPVVYMLREILTMKSVCENNRSLWPLSVSLHAGIYLIILALVFYLINALLMIAGAPQGVIDVFLTITAVIVAAGCIIGIIGAAGLILKRALDADYSSYSTFSSYFKLVLLLAVFASGGISMLMPGGYALEMSRFTEGIITLETNISVSVASAVHILISFLFVLYLPFTNMVHFITKHFTYYGVRWNDKPLDGKTAVRVKELQVLKSNWSAGHASEGGHEKT